MRLHDIYTIPSYLHATRQQRSAVGPWRSTPRPGRPLAGKNG